MNEVKDITIIGAGPVGLFGAFYAGLRGMSVRITDALDAPGGQLIALYPEKPIYDMPGFPEVLAKDLVSEMVRQADRFEPEYALGKQSQSLLRSGENWEIVTNGGSFLSKTVVICAGLGAFQPTRIGVAREEEFDGHGLTYGVREIATLSGKRCIVVGGGDSALDWALALVPVAAAVTLVHRRDKFVAHEESLTQLHASPVMVRTWEVISELHGSDQLEAITVHNRQEDRHELLDCDALIVCIGYKTSLGPIKDWGLEFEKTKIKVNARQETNLSGVYAAGDVCTHDGKLDLIATGVGEVCTAVNFAKTLIEPSANVFPGHSSDMNLPSLK